VYAVHQFRTKDSAEVQANVSSHQVQANQSYAALDTACRDVRTFATVSFVLGVIIFGVAIFFAASIAKILASVLVLSYFPFASSFILWQHLISLRMKQAEYGTASRARRQEIAAEVRQYAEMMLASGLTAPVTGLIGALRLRYSPEISRR
jgi:hypothetical protein